MSWLNQPLLPFLSQLVARYTTRRGKTTETREVPVNTFSAPIFNPSGINYVAYPTREAYIHTVFDTAKSRGAALAVDRGNDTVTVAWNTGGNMFGLRMGATTDEQEIVYQAALCYANTVGLDILKPL